ncbi:hypothetical protein SDRG_03981 [Saprolegnia diclina VS20]|uniref:Uncharacterized protein n=1 Tax=Saprolegnia diclina (strain VS20) TaxID=1156394 RepID=T0QLV5_SAPDV|nr:hypothetical protein SDRG_03981 [Saprolegnia diclina VS20]EQC39029.1 hypothetical protein SDRG_03981 [Saprolegnia diclina VS20]|eukprot:XP_008607853.1 hypothetical protein SDRG_03981 [Saprolegnia diclina VS20]
MRVAPTESHVHALAAPRSSRLALLARLYVVVSSALSLYFLVVILQPNITNDLWWAGFTTAGPQTEEL